MTNRNTIGIRYALPGCMWFFATSFSISFPPADMLFTYVFLHMYPTYAYAFRAICPSGVPIPGNN